MQLFKGVKTGKCREQGLAHRALNKCQLLSLFCGQDRLGSFSPTWAEAKNGLQCAACDTGKAGRKEIKQVDQAQFCL